MIGQEANHPICEADAASRPRRGFVRYADDCNIYVRSRRAGERVMTSVTSFVTKRLQLQVNTAKSAATPCDQDRMGTPGVDRPLRRKFLGFSFTAGNAPPRRRIAPQALARFKSRVRELTRRTKGASLEQTIEGLRIYLTGWLGYFGFCQTPSVLRELHQWLRRRLRAFAWKQWRNGWNRLRQLSRRGIPRRLAAQTAGSRTRGMRSRGTSRPTAAAIAEARSAAVVQSGCAAW